MALFVTAAQSCNAASRFIIMYYFNGSKTGLLSKSSSPQGTSKETREAAESLFPLKEGETEWE